MLDGSKIADLKIRRLPSTSTHPFFYVRCTLGLSAASTISELATGASVVALGALFGLPDLAAAEAPGWVGPTKLVLDPILLYFEVAFVARIILSWYPKVREARNLSVSCFGRGLRLCGIFPVTYRMLCLLGASTCCNCCGCDRFERVCPRLGSSC